MPYYLRGHYSEKCGAQPMKRVLFVCIHNAGRSQMAEALFNELA